MEAELLEKYRVYITTHNPELVLMNQDIYPLSRYIRERMDQVMPTLKYLQDIGKPEHEVIALCLDHLTRELKPSKADYLREVLETEFPREQHTLRQAGTLTYNVVALIRHCDEVFGSFGFRENHTGSTLLRHAVIARVQDYLVGLNI